MAMSTDHNAWIREKLSWLITCDDRGMGNFESMDPPTGIWTIDEVRDHLGDFIARGSGHPDFPDHFGTLHRQRSHLLAHLRVAGSLVCEEVPLVRKNHESVGQGLNLRWGNTRFPKSDSLDA